MNVYGFKRIRNAVALVIVFAASSTHAAESMLAGSIQNDWDEPSLALSLPGGSGDAVVLGDFYQVLVTAKSDGYLYLVQQNSQERASGKMRLIQVTRKLPGYSGGNAFMYPAVDSLKAAPPLGLAEVQAIYSSHPLTLNNGVGEQFSEGEEYTLTQQEMVELIERSQSSDPEIRIAVQSIAYEVAVADGELEHTTRGIARQINTAITSADLEPDNDGVLTSFDAHIQFEFGSAEPTFNGQLQLDAFGDVLTRPDFGHIQFVVAGHTDDIGERDFNLDLSEARAKAVTEYLQENYDIPSTRMIVEALGEDAPYVDNSDTESRALNRRVEFTLLN
jgi:outer membrane protein OmpA-like peptidoglycan-associated protein